MNTTQEMTTTDVANRLVELCRTGKFMDAVNELYAENILSIEPKGAQHERTEGKEAAITKGIEFFSAVEQVHSTEISDALIADNFFSLTMKLDLTMKGMGRIVMDELCVYNVKDGQIVFEQFFYTPAVM